MSTPQTDEDVVKARERLRAKYSNTQPGGKGSVRRKKATVHKAQSSDDKKILSTAKRAGAVLIQQIDEVTIFLADDDAIQFTQPKVHANVGANMYVITGRSEKKTVAELSQDMLQKVAGAHPEYQQMMQQMLRAQQGQKAAGGAKADEDEEAPPPLEGDFQTAAEAD